MKKLSIITLCGLIATPAFADIASKSYVDNIKTALESSLDNKLPGTFTGKGNKVLTTNGSGEVDATTIVTNMIAESNVTNSKLAGGIGINKLSLPTNKCSSGSCILIYDAGTQTYTWESIIRGTGDSAPSGGVDGNGSSN